ncbi:hypothetical protein [Legionella brunensis]|uniref:Uncharacterized protein n=1 Tax=Legionella brunensis TaxID=29422 RepID=A0A0W0SU71_9GAMM|nr:hypothetical protein [Legionella brunensis]KTC86918.1 hypothetical protein Lbru_0147 [Legionella brunensis]
MLRAFGFTSYFFNSPPTPPQQKLDSSVTFDYRNTEHIDIIKNRIARFKQAQAAIYSFDNKIISGLAVGTVCWAGASIPLPFTPTITISLASFSYASYQLGRRPDSGLLEPYREALTDLIEVYKWSMHGKTNTWYKLGVPQIQDLILTLGPWVPTETIAIWEEKDLEPGRFSSRGLEPTKEFKDKLNELAAGAHTKSIWFSVYGENGTDDLINAASAYLKQVALGAAEKYAPTPVTTLFKLHNN